MCDGKKNDFLNIEIINGYDYDQTFVSETNFSIK